MSQGQRNIISGSFYDKYASGDLKANDGRMPRVGQRVEFEDGRCFVFCSTAADLSAGDVVATAACTELTTAVAAAAGATTLTTAATTVAANAWAGGFMTIILGAGAGKTYKIKSNTAASAAASTVVLYDPLQDAIAATDDITFTPNLHAGVVQGTAALHPIGVACATTTAATDSDTQYFWAQTRGVAFGKGVADADGDNTALMAGASGALVPKGIDDIRALVAHVIEGGDTNGVVYLRFE